MAEPIHPSNGAPLLDDARPVEAELALAGGAFCVQQSGTRILGVLQTRGWPQARKAPVGKVARRALGDRP